MKADLVTIEIDARHLLNEQLNAGATRRNAIIYTRDQLMKIYEISRSDCELICWKSYSNRLAAAVPMGTYIDLSQTCSNLLVVRTPHQKIIFTLFDLLVFAQEAQSRDTKATVNSVITETIH